MTNDVHNAEDTFNLSNEAFYDPIQKNVEQLQTLFDAYQQACFQARPSEFFALELCGEAGELANLEKKRWKGKAVNPHDIGDEAADVLIALMNFANASGINLGEALRSKLVIIEDKRRSLVELGETY